MASTFLYVILGFVLAEALLDLVLELLNRASLAKPIPIELKGAFCAHMYEKGVAYAKECSKANLIQLSTDLVFLLLFWSCGGFGWLDNLVRSFGFPLIITGICFALILESFEQVMCMGFDIYQTFILDKKYGFTTTSVSLYIKDQIKSVALSWVSTTLFISYFIFCLGMCGVWGLPLLIVSMFVFNLVMQKYVGIWMMYMYNTFTPLKTGRLKRAITKYVKKVNFPMKGVYIMDASKRSTATNAFFAGIGSSRRIVLYDTLVEDHNVPEIVAVIGHEVGHCVHNHITKGMILEFIKGAISIILLWYFSQQAGLFQAFGVSIPSIYVAIPLMHLGKIPWSVLTNTFENILSRKWEREADQYELDTVNNPGASVRAFRKLAASNLANLTPHPLHVFLNYSHPPLDERIRHALAFKKKAQGEGK